MYAYIYIYIGPGAHKIRIDVVSPGFSVCSPGGKCSAATCNDCRPNASGQVVTMTARQSHRYLLHVGHLRIVYTSRFVRVILAQGPC